MISAICASLLHIAGISLAWYKVGVRGHASYLATLEPQHGMPGSSATRFPTCSLETPSPTPTTSLQYTRDAHHAFLYPPNLDARLPVQLAVRLLQNKLLLLWPLLQEVSQTWTGSTLGGSKSGSRACSLDSKPLYRFTRSMLSLPCRFMPDHHRLLHYKVSNPALHDSCFL